MITTLDSYSQSTKINAWPRIKIFNRFILPITNQLFVDLN